MFGTVWAAAISGMTAAMAENEAFMRTLDGLPEQERQRRIDRRQDRLDAERRHREQLTAIRESRQNSGVSMAGLIVGAAIFGSMCD